MRQSKKIEKPAILPQRDPKLDLGRVLLNLETISEQLELMPTVPAKAETQAIINQAHDLVTEIRSTL